VDKYKGLEFLIDSYALIARKYPDWTLDIYGQSEPPEYIEKLQKRINKKHLENCIFFKGITNSPKDTLLEYDFCVFPSYFEGFPLGLSDALSVGLPSIGLKACSGVNELIIDGETGLLADFNKKDYASKISYLIEQKDLRKRMSENAVQSMKRYDKSLVLKIWLDLINDIFNHTEKVPETNSSICKYKIFPIKKISKVDRVNKWFSINRDLNKTKIYFLGIKFSIKNKHKKKKGI
jgi:glycosyltransferase involved in cell wall biosynthesis